MHNTTANNRDIGIEENDSIGTQRHIAINNLKCGLGWSTRVNGMNEGVLPDSSYLLRLRTPEVHLTIAIYVVLNF